MSDNMDDVYAALQRADAAGDTATAQQLSDYIRAQKTAPAEEDGYSSEEYAPPKPKSRYDQLKQNFAQAASMVLSKAHEARELVGAVAEPVMQQASAFAAKPIADVAGLAATGYEAATGGQNPQLPAAFRSDVQRALTYEPRTEMGRAPANPLNAIPRAMGEAVQAVTPEGAAPGEEATPLGMAQNALREAVPQAVNIAALKYNPTAVKALRKAGAAAPEMEGVGAAEVSPENLVKQRAEELGAPPPRKSVATQDPLQAAREAELMKTEEGRPLAAAVSKEREVINHKLDQYVDATGYKLPEDPELLGKSLRDTLSGLMEKERGAVRDAYAAADASPEAGRMVSYGPLREYFGNLTPTRQADRIPSILKEELMRNDPKGTGEMTVRQMEDVRRAVGEEVNPADRTSVRYGTTAKGLIDKQLEDTGGDLYKQARALRREFAQNYEDRQVVADIVSNKAWWADNKIPLEKIFDRTILSPTKSRADVVFLRNILRRAGPEGEQAWREVQAKTIQHVRDAVYESEGKDAYGVPVPSWAKMKRTMAGLEYGGKLDAVLGKESAEQLRQLKDYMNDTLNPPAGTPINYSNTSSALVRMLEAAERKTRELPGVHKATEFLSSQAMKAERQREVEEALNYTKPSTMKSANNPWNQKGENP